MKNGHKVSTTFEFILSIIGIIFTIITACIFAGNLQTLLAEINNAGDVIEVILAILLLFVIQVIVSIVSIVCGAIVIILSARQLNQPDINVTMQKVFLILGIILVQGNILMNVALFVVPGII